MPFPYATPEQFERECPYGPEDFGLSESEWQDLVYEKLEQETERVETWIDDDYRERDAAEVPLLVRGAVIRLTREVIAQIEEDGLSSESLASGAQYSYRPPEEIRADTRDQLVKAGYATRAARVDPTIVHID